MLFWHNFFVQNLDASMELCQCQLLSQRILFFSWQNGTLSFFLGPVNFFFFFSTRTFFCFLFFHEQIFFPKKRASTCEFCQVHDANNMKNEPKDVWLWPKLSQRICLGMKLWHLPDWLIFVWNYNFINNPGAFGDFKTFFFWEMLVKCLKSV